VEVKNVRGLVLIGLAVVGVVIVGWVTLWVIHQILGLLFAAIVGLLVVGGVWYAVGRARNSIGSNRRRSIR
jgi:hypothetical protein